MDRLKIAHRLYAGFALVTLMLIAVSVVGYFYLSAAAYNTSETVRVFSQNVELERALKFIAKGRAGFYEAVGQPARQAELFARMDEAFSAAETKLDSVVQTTRDPGRKGKATEMRDTLKTYHAGVMTLAGQIQSGDKAAVNSDLRSQLAATYPVIDKLGTELSDAYGKRGIQIGLRAAAEKLRSQGYGTAVRQILAIAPDEARKMGEV